MFGSSSSDLHTTQAPEEVNESKLEVTSENIPHTDEAEEINRKRDVRDAAWLSQWEGPKRENAVTGSGRNHYMTEEGERRCKFILILLLHRTIKINNNRLYGTLVIRDFLLFWALNNGF
jgi:hypothetical protein